MTNGGTTRSRALNARIESSRGAEGECWAWSGDIDRHGYGELRWKQDGRARSERAHRAVYELLVGPIPPGLVIDHLCRVRPCVNPAHLEPVTVGENIRRGETGRVWGDRQRALTHCKHGHEFTPENTYLRRGKWRACRQCAKRRRRNMAA